MVSCGLTVAFMGEDPGSFPEEEPLKASIAAATIDSYTVNDGTTATVYIGEEVTFTASASSTTSSELTFTFFYDAILDLEQTPNPYSPYSTNVTGNPGTVTTTYTYDRLGNLTTYGVSYYRVKLSVDDGTSTVNMTRTVYVIQNSAPDFVLDLSDNYVLDPDESIDLSIRVSDPDGDAVTVTWDFGDGTVAVNETGPAPTSVFVNQTHAWSPVIGPGMGPALWYGMVVTLEDPYANVESQIVNVTISLPDNGLPIISLEASVATPEPGVETTFYANAVDPEGEALTWTFMVNNSIEDVDVLTFHTDVTPPGTEVWNNLTYTFEDPGTYAVTLWVSDALIPYQVFPHNVSRKVLVAVAINQVPAVTSAISVSDESPQIDVAIGFLDVYLMIQVFDFDGDVLTASWYIGDAVDPVVNVSAGGIVVYEFTQVMTITEPGSYNISVVVTDGHEGHEVTVCRTLNATSNNLPPSVYLIEFSYALGDYAVPMEEIEFRVLITDPELDPIEVIFEFGDDSPQQHFNLTDYVDGNVTILISHAYQSPGVYLGTIWYTDNKIGILNHSKYFNMKVTVKEAPVIEDNSPPVADAGEDQEVIVGEEVQFDGNGSDDDIGIVNYTWEFTYDDETRELYGVSPTFTFDIAGTYIVTLIVEDAEGETDTDTVTVIVEKRSFVESYGLFVGIVIALAIVMLVLLFILKGRKGGTTLAGTERENTVDTEP